MPQPPTLPRLSSIPSLPSHPTHTTSSETAQDHAILQAHYLGFQKTLLTAVDGHMADLEAQLRAKDHAVHMTEEEKKNVGVELYKAKKEIGGLNEGLGKIRALLQFSEHARTTLSSDRSAAERELSRLLHLNTHLTSTLTSTRTQLDGSALKLAQMHDVNAAYFSSIKIQKRVEEKLKREVEGEAEKRKAVEAALEEAEKRCEALLKDKKELEDVLKGQRSETAMAQGAMNKMQREIKDLTLSKKQLEKQWEDSLSAMAKRDQTFQAVDSAKTHLATRVREAENALRVLKLEKEEAEKMAREKEFECTGLHDTLKTIRGTLTSADRTGRDTRNELVEAQVAESLYRQELDKVTKNYELSRDEIQRKNQTISELKARIESMKREFDEKLQNETITQVARKEEHLTTRFSSETQHALHAAENQTVTLRHDNATLRLQLAALKETLAKLEIEKTTLSDSNTHLTSHYSTLYTESQRIIYELEKKEHDVNKLKGALTESKHEDKTLAHRLELQHMQAELAACKAENERLQNRWLTEKKQALKRTQMSETLKDDKEFLQTQLGITDTIRLKSGQEITDAKRAAIEATHEAARMCSEVKRLQPVLEEMRRKNTLLETQLTEAKFALEEAGVTQTTKTHMLTHEIRRLHSARQHIQLARIADERAAHGLERKYVLAREMVDKLKSERYDAAKREADLTRRLEDLEKRWCEERSVRAALEREERREKGARRDSVSLGNVRKSTLPLWKSLLSTPMNGSPSSRDPPPSGVPDAAKSASSGSVAPSAEPRVLLQDVPDLEAWRLKIDTLTSEKAYLTQENKLLQQRIEQLASTCPANTNNNNTTATHRAIGRGASVGVSVGKVQKTE
ncbi:hypothetical protein DFJ77DRAFT_477750 [Powellomyces hirtus]|nr:hypothetical protein DFJ77DRAFT_477750 [Powellomyces hirtus]